MTLETGAVSNSQSSNQSIQLDQSKRKSGKNASSGFTLLEILLVFALMALTASVMIANFTTFLDFDANAAPEETLYAAIRAARFEAASKRQITSLRFDKEAGALVLSSGENFSLNAEFGEEGRSEIRFYLVSPAEGLGTFPKAIDSRLETKEIRFAPDRSSSPFVVEIDTNQGSPTRMAFDPFSSLVRNSE
jgi:Tfp pilus assembly protein FimT